jgi:hypothetical protein
MNNLIFYSSVNTPGRHDATGAFIPAARAFAKLHGGTLIPVNCLNENKTKRQKQILGAIDAAPDRVDSVSFFCHGWPRGVQFGFDITKTSIPALAAVAAKKSTDDLIVSLYCCSTADGPDIGDESYPDDDETGTPAPGTDGGFADHLRDKLSYFGAINCKVIAHRKGGHTTKNPHVVVFEGGGDPEGGIGGRWIIDPKDDLWPAWRAALKTDMRFRFPFMTMEEIEKELRGGK